LTAEEKREKFKKRKEMKTAQKKKRSITFENKKHSLEDFKKRTLSEIKKTEEKIERDKTRKVETSQLRGGKLGYVTGRNDPVKPSATEKKEHHNQDYSAIHEERVLSRHLKPLDTKIPELKRLNSGA